jgi:hypothetical protein
MYNGRKTRIQVKRSLNYFKVPRACPWVSTREAMGPAIDTQVMLIRCHNNLATIGLFHIN